MEFKYSEPLDADVLAAVKNGLKVMALYEERKNEKWCGDTSVIDTEIAKLTDEIKGVVTVEVLEV